MIIYYMNQSLSYSTAIYTLGRKWATLYESTGDAMFPDRYSLHDMAAFVARQQRHCFKLDNVGENTERLFGVFEGDTKYLAIVVGQIVEEGELLEFDNNVVDQVTATLQHADHVGQARREHGGGDYKKLPNQWWMHEICRYKNPEAIMGALCDTMGGVANAKDWLSKYGGNPTNDAMTLLENIVFEKGEPVYLMVEREPVESSDFLLGLYSKKGYTLMPDEDAYVAYRFMAKESSVGGSEGKDSDDGIVSVCAGERRRPYRGRRRPYRERRRPYRERRRPYRKCRRSYRKCNGTRQMISIKRRKRTRRK